MAVVLRDADEGNGKECVKSHTVKFHIVLSLYWGESLGILKVRAVAVSVEEDREGWCLDLRERPGFDILFHVETSS